MDNFLAKFAKLGLLALLAASVAMFSCKNAADDGDSDGDGGKNGEWSKKHAGFEKITGTFDEVKKSLGEISTGECVVELDDRCALDGLAGVLRKDGLKVHLDMSRMSLLKIDDKMFQNCVSLACVNLPDGATRIGASAFSGCASLSSVKIPEGVTSIGGSAFSGCTSLSSVNIPKNVASIEPVAFSGCTSLSSVKIPEGVTSIGISAFSGCASLSSVNVPKNVTSIGALAFSGCASLSSVNVPKNVTSIGSSAFSGCGKLARATFENPEGWQYGKKDAKDLTDVAESLSDKSLAAQCLRELYVECRLQRK